MHMSKSMYSLPVLSAHLDTIIDDCHIIHYVVEDKQSNDPANSKDNHQGKGTSKPGSKEQGHTTWYWEDFAHKHSTWIYIKST